MTPCHIELSQLFFRGGIQVPKTTFANLPVEKKEKILASARKEFSSTAFEDVSINKIVKGAEIPRGSFYMYFIDKNDLLALLLEEFRNQFVAFLSKKASRSKGNLHEMVVGTHDFIVLASHNQENCGLIRNFLLYSAKNPEHIANRFFHNMMDNFIKLIDTSSFKEKDERYIREVVESSFAILKETIHQTLVMNRPVKESHECFERHLAILENGYLIKENESC